MYLCIHVVIVTQARERCKQCDAIILGVFENTNGVIKFQVCRTGFDYFHLHGALKNTYNAALLNDCNAMWKVLDTLHLKVRQVGLLN